jgi:hypothetical protein
VRRRTRRALYSETAGIWADHAERRDLAAGREPVPGNVLKPPPVRIPKVAQERMIPRPVVRAVACPRCDAAPGRACITEDGSARPQNHSARVAAYRRQRTREIVRKVACQDCGAAPGVPCIRRNGMPRKSNHLARVAQAELVPGETPAASPQPVS